MTGSWWSELAIPVLSRRVSSRLQSEIFLWLSLSEERCRIIFLYLLPHTYTIDEMSILRTLKSVCSKRNLKHKLVGLTIFAIIALVAISNFNSVDKKFDDKGEGFCKFLLLGISFFANPCANRLVGSCWMATEINCVSSVACRSVLT